METLKKYINASYERIVALREIAEEAVHHGLKINLQCGDKTLTMTPYESAVVIEQLTNIITAPYEGFKEEAHESLHEGA